jgi:hypothetical protein
MIQCVPVPSTTCTLSHRSLAIAANNRQIKCDYCDTKREHMQIDEYGGCRCMDCCIKMLTSDKRLCVRCDRHETEDSRLIVNHRRLCNVCLNAKACDCTEQGTASTLLMEVSKLRTMMLGELPIGEQVTVRYLTPESINLELNSFMRNGVNTHCPFGPAGVIV